MQCGVVAPFCFRDIPFEHSYLAVVGDELHGEDRGGNDGSRSTRWILAAVSDFVDLGSCSLELCSVASWHLSASEMSPLSTPTSPLSVTNFMVKIEVAMMAPTLFRAGLPMIALYAEL
ncbi:hypothetical protein PIB30_046406 [Stylosanthes scabra]|uniref:Uncharacterized protein n=1 Tax=Stylosanthes scabra TaxID=79078 RepID=A0ABU6TG50_9FABA|nr:hypothetical protein [Stylosanthes scabra]